MKFLLVVMTLPDHPVRVWSADQTGKAIFYYEKAINETFLSVVT